MVSENRFRNVKQAEYELLKVILEDERIREILHERLKRGILGGRKRSQVARERANKALTNISTVLRGMMVKRIKHLPEYQIDHDSESDDQ